MRSLAQAWVKYERASRYFDKLINCKNKYQGSCMKNWKLPARNKKNISKYLSRWETPALFYHPKTRYTDAQMLWVDL